MRKRNIFYITFFLGFIFLIFRNWFLIPQIIGGDWPYFFPEMLRDPSVYFSSWNPGQGNGLGGVNPIYSLGMFFGFTVFLAHTFSIPWVFIYKFFWFALPLLSGILSSIYLVKTIFPQSSLWQRLFSSFIFTTNTYFLMVVGGGQMGVALAYSLTPLVLARFIKLIDHSVASNKNFQFFPPIAGSRFGGTIFNFQLALLAGLVLAIQVMFDPRIAYISMIAVAIYMILNLKKNILNTFSPLEALAKWGYLILNNLIIPGFVAVLLHAAWILPILFFQSSLIPQGLTSADGFRFFSFADFSHAFSLLHPNWPENIFGKTYFLKPEFILLPILAFNGLLSISKNQISKIHNEAILFFSLLALLGMFLAKGASEPFGFVNLWLFEHIPGFAMFRDPTKFYLLIALSYSVLIPFSIYSIYEWLSAKSKFSIFNFQFSIKSKIFNIPNLFLILTTLYLILIIRPAIIGQLGGTFTQRKVPIEYFTLKDFLYRQQGFFRTLWIPRQHRFTYNFWSRMPVEAEPLFKKSKIVDIVNQLRKPETREYLSELGVKYIIVPYDPYGEIFVKDRKYDSLAYQQAVWQLEAVPWLKKLDGFGKIAVFETPSFGDYFKLGEGGTLTYEMISPSEYRVFVDINQPTSLIFSENYHSEWISTINSATIKSQKTKSGTNSFPLVKSGSYKIDVRFYQERFYDYGKIVSLVVLLLALFLILGKKLKIG